MTLIQIPAARPFSEAAVAGRGRGRPITNFDQGSAARARVAASRWQTQNRARTGGGNSEHPWTAATNRQEAARTSSARGEARRNSRFAQIEGAESDTARFKDFRPKPPLPDDEQENAPF